MSENPLAVQDDRPAYLTTETNKAGFEHMRQEDLIVPRLMVMQALSPAVVENKAITGEGRDSLTNELVLPKGEGRAFAIVFHYLEWILWGDRKTGEGILDRSTDMNGKLAKDTRRDADNKPIVTEYHNFIVMVEGRDAPILLSFSKASHKYGRMLLNLARMRNAAIFAGRYMIGIRTDTNKAGQSYCVPVAENAGWVEQETYEQLKVQHATLAEMYESGRIAAHQDTPEESTNDAPAAPPPAQETTNVGPKSGSGEIPF